MPFCTLPGSDMPDVSDPVTRADCIRQQQMNELAEWHAMFYPTTPPRAIANRFREHYTHWPEHIYYAPRFAPVLDDAEKAWLLCRGIEVVIDERANAWGWAGPRQHS